MSEVSKFIPIEENGETENEEVVKCAGAEAENSAFKVCGTGKNLPAKPSFWSKLKGVLTYEVKVELTPIFITPVSKLIKSLNLFSALFIYSMALLM